MTPVAEVVSELRRDLPSAEDAAQRWQHWLDGRLSPKAVDMVLKGYGVSSRFRRLEPSEDLLPAECRKWVALADQGAAMILAGPPGTGKTTAAVWCLRALYERWSREGREIPKAKIVKTRDLYAAVFDKNAALIREVERCDALVIDDWGTAYEHEWPLAELEAVIDRRWDECRPTIVTTNMNPSGKGSETLQQKLPRSYDRLTGDPGPGVVILDRPSLRQGGR
ncbi:MAG: hypothetical protein NXI30_04430 [bacterium]|nr:hypothetical protein [bacterium]